MAESKLDASMDSKAEFKLSTTLNCSGSGVRDVAFAGNDMLCTCEERGALTVWERKEGSKDFVTKAVTGLPMVHEKGLTFCVEPVRSYGPGTFMSGGADKAARPFSVTGGVLPPLLGHTNCVNSVSETSTGDVVTGSWDGTAKIWRQGQCVKTLTGHEHAVEVLGLATGQIVTASGNKSIIIFDNQGTLLRRIPNAHAHAIRKLIAHPLGFASAGNDGFVKIWSNQGDAIVNIDTHSRAQPAFVYGVTLLGNGDVAACGEDGNVCIWSSDGSRLVQTLRHPAPVRSVKTLPNGDLLTACADKCARIFTRDASRQATAEQLAEYDHYIQLTAASAGMKELDTDTLPDESALLQPGKKDGDIKVVKVQGKGMVFKWNAAKIEWEVFGEAVGRKQKVTLQGADYDFVTDVVLDGGRTIPLGINRDDDPYDLATKFCNTYGIPFTVRQQIIDHITPMTDPKLVALRKANDQAMQDATRLIHVPSWSSGGFHLHSEMKTAAFKAKILQTSSELGGDLALTPNEQKALTLIVQHLDDKPNYHCANFTQEERALMLKMLTWPTNALPAVLDGVRGLMCLTSACKLGHEEAFQQKLLAVAQAGTHVHKSLTLKALTNWLAKRDKPASERQKIVAPQILEFLQRAMQTLTPAEENATLLSSFIMFVYNIVVWLGRINPADAAPLFGTITRSLLNVLRSPELKDMSVFYGLLTLGSLAYCDRGVVLAEGLTELRPLLQSLRERNRASVAIQQVAEDVSRVLGV